MREFAAIVFGEGDFHTADRRSAAAAAAGSRRSPRARSAVGDRPDHARSSAPHPRSRFDGRPTPSGPAWRGTDDRFNTRTFAEPLALWDVWTAIAGPPVAFEPPSAGFVAGLADAERDAGAADRVRDVDPRRRHFVDRRRRARRPPAVRRAVRHSGRPPRRAIARARLEGRRVVAVGTTVVRALEHAARATGVFTRAAGWRISASGRRPGCRSSTRSSQASTRPGRATISCCGRSPTMRRSTGCSRR